MLSGPSHARITLALDIVRRLENGPYQGYHELGIIKHQIDLHDTVSVEPSAHMTITCADSAVPLDAANTCWKAAELLAQHGEVSGRVHVHIDKRLPVMGGMAGGSSNAATTLLLCNEMWQLGLSREDLIPLARLVGMDVPYYLFGSTAFDTEATGTIRPIPTKLELAFVIVIPDFGVSTREAYRAINYTRIARHGAATAAMERAFLSNDRDGVIASIHNDFELSVLPSHPQLSTIRHDLLSAGCQAACMTGSGSTMIGIARDLSQAREIAGRLHYHALVTSSTPQEGA